MRMYDIIDKKRHGDVLTEAEIRFVIAGYTKGDIPDYQMASLAMAICLVGMDRNETAILTDAMMHSGDVVDLSAFGHLSVDKHSTGGVGDKTTLILAPIVAALGGKVAKMSGRGLGNTGGTIDKLESIPGFRTQLTPAEFTAQVEKIGVAVVGQTGNLAPADKKLYALRDVTATVESVPLIASSIMSKKLAAGTHSIVLDVKVGDGAFMKTLDQARTLAKAMVEIGTACGRNVRALLTDMGAPLGYAVGNSLEVAEAAEILQGGGNARLREICVTLSSNMLSLCHGWDLDESRRNVLKTIDSGTAFDKMQEWVSAQGGDASVLKDPSKFVKQEYACEIKAPSDGYVTEIRAGSVGETASILGAGRLTKEDTIDLTAGVRLTVQRGDFVRRGDVVARLYTEKESRIEDASNLLASAFSYSKEKPEDTPIIFETV